MDPASAFQQYCAADRGGDTLYLPTWSIEDWRRLFGHAHSVSVSSGDVLIRHGNGIGRCISSSAVLLKSLDEQAAVTPSDVCFGNNPAPCLVKSHCLTGYLAQQPFGLPSRPYSCALIMSSSKASSQSFPSLGTTCCLRSDACLHFGCAEARSAICVIVE